MRRRFTLSAMAVCPFAVVACHSPSPTHPGSVDSAPIGETTSSSAPRPAEHTPAIMVAADHNWAPNCFIDEQTETLIAFAPDWKSWERGHAGGAEGDRWRLRSLDPLTRNEARPWSESPDGRKKITCEEPADGRLLCRVEEVPAGRPFPQLALPAPRARMRGEQLWPVLTPLFQWSPRGTFVYVYRPWWAADGPVRQDGLYDLSSRRLRRPFGAGGEPLRTEPGSPMGAGDVPATRLPLSPDDRLFARETNGGIVIGCGSPRTAASPYFTNLSAGLPGHSGAGTCLLA